MSEVLTDNDDDELEIVEVDTLPAPGETPKPEVADEEDKADVSDDDDDDEDDGEDRRLEGHDDDDADSPERKKRRRRKQLQKEAKERTLRELDMLRRQNAELEKRLGAVESTTHTAAKTDTERRLAEVQNDIRTAEMILAKAIEAGNGEDAATAMRLRDEARDAAAQLQTSVKDYDKPKQTQVDPNVATLAGAWKQANPWYDSRGLDEDSAIVNAIDATLTRQGYDPASRDYWTELTKRVNSRFGAGQVDPEERTQRTDGREKRKAPPLGNGRDHAPASTRQEVYVTPERKQAMIDAGYWDDPKTRTRMLKAYAEFDRDQSSGR